MVDKEKLKKYINHWLFLAIICFALFVFSLTMFIYMLVNYCIDINANYVEETATITRYEEVYRNPYYDYSLFYEYEAPDGTIYSGVWKKRIANIDYVEEKLGTKIKIYVAHDLHRHMLKLEFKTDTIVIYAVIAATSLVVYIIFLLKYLSCIKLNKSNVDRN